VQDSHRRRFDVLPPTAVRLLSPKTRTFSSEDRAFLSELAKPISLKGNREAWRLEKDSSVSPSIATVALKGLLSSFRSQQVAYFNHRFVRTRDESK
jgi:hypothetical protein